MKTNFSLAQLADPDIATTNDILRKCVHCGFCTATCPTYILLGDELDSPRGRIYLIQDMLEKEAKPTEHEVKHIDRCLSCLSCTSTCPASVDYMHLIDYARTYVQKNYKRPVFDRLFRAFLNKTLPNPTFFRLSALAGFLAKPLKNIVKILPKGKILASTIELAKMPNPPQAAAHIYPALGQKKGRVALLSGCANPVLRPDLNETTIRLLNRHGVEVVLPKGETCCGALSHHLGYTDDSHEYAKRNIDAWLEEAEVESLDAIVVNASGCGTTLKDYGFMFRNDAAYAQKAERVSSLVMDITEYMAQIGLTDITQKSKLKVAYHSACSMQHGQKLKSLPKDLLKNAGFNVSDIPEGHICCGSAGTYNILQPEIAEQLKHRKINNIQKVSPDLVATGNIGCMVQLGSGSEIPIVHTVELLDWATGGPEPDALRS